MKITLAQLVGGRQSLAGLYAQKTNTARFAFILKKLRVSANTSLQPYDEAYNELLAKHGERGERPNVFVIAPENFPAFTAEHGELLKAEIELDAQPVSLGAIESEGLKVSADDLSALEWLIVGE